MRRIYLVLVILFVGCVLPFHIGCQHRKVSSGEHDMLSVKPAPSVALKPAKASPKITFEKIVYDFGRVGPKTKHHGEFKFTNTGERLLKISEVETCCGVAVKLEKKEYAPGESGVLKIEYHSTGVTGATVKKLYVNSNDKATPKITLTIKSEVIQKVIWQPKKLKLVLSEENAGCPEIIISSVDNKPFSITAFKSTLECITADVDASVEASRFVLQPKVDMEKLRKAMRGSVYVSMNHPDCEGFGIGFDVLSMYEIKPPLLVIFYVDPKKPIKRYVWVLNNYGKDFEIESTSSKEGFVKLVDQKKIRNSYQLELEITPPAIEDKNNFTDQFFIKIKGGEQLRIVCQGVYSGKAIEN